MYQTNRVWVNIQNPGPITLSGIGGPVISLQPYWWLSPTQSDVDRFVGRRFVDAINAVLSRYSDYPAPYLVLERADRAGDWEYDIVGVVPGEDYEQRITLCPLSFIQKETDGSSRMASDGDLSPVFEFLVSCAPDVYVLYENDSDGYYSAYEIYQIDPDPNAPDCVWDALYAEGW